MRGYIDTIASELRAGDTIIDPWSGVLAWIESTEDKGKMLALHMRGSVSLSYMGITCEPDRPLRRAPRSGDIAVIQAALVPVEIKTTITYVDRPHAPHLCVCGAQLKTDCEKACLKG